MTTTTATGSYEALLDQLAADAAGAADQAAEADRRLRDAARLVENRRAAQHAADTEARARDRRAVELRALQHRVKMIDHALHVADLVASVGPALDDAEAEARAAVQAIHGHGPISTLREMRPKVKMFATRRARWVAERGELLRRIAAEERKA